MPHAVLIYQQDKQDPDDYRAILDVMADKAPDISGFIADSKKDDPGLAKQAYASAAITMSPMPLRRFTPLCGPIFQGNEYRKSYQYERMRAGGVNVPDWRVIGTDIRDQVTAQDWGDYVVVKPDLGRKGSEIFIKRTTRLKYTDPETYPEGHLLRKAPMLAQKFIYTGRWPHHFRIVTFFGRCVLAWKVEQDNSYPPLESRYGFKGGGISIVSNKRSSTYRETREAAAIELAEAAHRCFPELPLLGSDIVKDCETGDWYVLECNPRGDAWHFSSAIGRDVQAIHGIDAKSQFDWQTLMAEGLIEQTRKFADSDAARNFSAT